MWERDDVESGAAEVRPDDLEGQVEEPGRRRVPGLFSEMGTGITARELVIRRGEEGDEERRSKRDETPYSTVLRMGPNLPLMTFHGREYCAVIRCDARLTLDDVRL